MIELSLDLINAQSPYEVSYAPNGVLDKQIVISRLRIARG